MNTLNISKINLKSMNRFMVGNGGFIHTYYYPFEVTLNKLKGILQEAERNGQQVYYVKRNHHKGVLTI
ncbi:hypothetical protein [Siminovitchia sp. 179-K 8D1 HS]|uniref:hypothetical protein n=1 Tax=Siminovitchia sp. 179-K 8D1 HS TaxID=3142385 RepID=UPI00399F05B4